MKKSYWDICGSYRKFKNPKLFWKKVQAFSIICNKWDMKIKKYLNKMNQLR